MGIAYNGSTQAATLSDITLGDFTVATWYRADDEEWIDSAFAADNYSATPRWAIVFKTRNASTTCSVEAHANGTGGVLAFTRPSVGTWNSLVITRSGTTVTVYLNGSSQGTQTVGSGSGSFPNWRIGCHYYSGGNNEFCNCSIANFAIYDAVLDAGEIAAFDAGVSALLIRPSSLLRYIDGTGGRAVEEMAGDIGDVGAAGTATDQPIIIRPSHQILQFPAAAPAGGGGTSSKLTLLGVG